MKTCIACGMPMREASEFAMNDTGKDYCVYCARSDGSMQSFEEKQEGLTAFLVKTQGLDREVAANAAEAMMRKLPAWEGHFAEKDRQEAGEAAGEKPASGLSELPNVGKVLYEHLLAIGIETPQQLRQTGAEEAFLRIRLQRDPGACLHMLYGIQGAILGIPDKLLPAEIKEALSRFYNGL